MNYREFLAAGNADSSWEAYAAEQNRLSRESGDRRVVAAYAAEGVSGNAVVNLLRGRGVDVPAAIKKILQHDDTVVSAKAVVARGLSRSEARKVWAWSQVAMAVV